MVDILMHKKPFYSLVVACKRPFQIVFQKDVEMICFTTTGRSGEDVDVKECQVFHAIHYSLFLLLCAPNK